jgi:hypothetical protein
MTDIKYIVVEKKSDGRIVPHGEHSFRVAPHVGEYIGINDDNGVGKCIGCLLWGLQVIILAELVISTFST